MSGTIQLKIYRYVSQSDPQHRFDRYDLPYRKEWTVLDALNHIKDHCDGSLSYRWSCRMGTCGSCGMMVNGEPSLACMTSLNGLAREGVPVRLEPLRNFPVVRDLVVDLTSFLHKLKKAKPWLIPSEEKFLSEGEYLQTPEQLAEFKQLSLCINCLLCYAACPVVSSDPQFVGPAALTLAERYNRDSRDSGASERTRDLSGHDGIWRCGFFSQCTEVCPSQVDPAAAIQQFKLHATLVEPTE